MRCFRVLFKRFSGFLGECSCDSSLVFPAGQRLASQTSKLFRFFVDQIVFLFTRDMTGLIYLKICHPHADLPMYFFPRMFQGICKPKTPVHVSGRSNHVKTNKGVTEIEFQKRLRLAIFSNHRMRMTVTTTPKCSPEICVLQMKTRRGAILSVNKIKEFHKTV